MKAVVHELPEEANGEMPECPYCHGVELVVRHKDDPEFLFCSKCGTTFVDENEMFVALKRGLDLDSSIGEAVKAANDGRANTSSLDGAGSTGCVLYTSPVLGEVVPETCSPCHAFYDD